MKLVSIYIVNHNYGHFLEEAIDSLKEYFQDDRFEVLIFDNDSSDNSREIISSYEEYFDGIYFQENIGLTATCNRALQLSKGKYVIRLDADDFFLPNGVHKLLEVAEKEKNDICFGNYIIVDFDGNNLRKVQREGVKDNRVLHRPSHGACTLINKEFLLEKGGYYGAFDRQDGYDLWLKAIYHGKVGFTSDYIFYYRNHGNNLTSNWDSILITRRHIKKYFFNEKNMPIDRVNYSLNLYNIKLEKSSLTLVKERIIQYISRIRENDYLEVISKDISLTSFCLNFGITIKKEPSVLDPKLYPISVIILNPILDVSFSAIEEAVISTYIFKAGQCISGEEIRKNDIYKYSYNGLNKYQLQENGDELDREKEDMYLKTNDFMVRNFNFEGSKMTYVQIPKNRY